MHVRSFTLPPFAPAEGGAAACSAHQVAAPRPFPCLCPPLPTSSSSSPVLPGGRRVGPRPRAPSGPWDYRVCLPEAGRGLSWPSWGLRRGQRHTVGSAQPRAPQSWVHGTPAYKRFWGPGPSTPRRSGGSPRHGVLLALWPFMAPPAPPQPQVAETLMSEEAWGGLGPASQTHLGPCFLHVAFLQVVPGELWHQLGQKMGSGLGSLVTVPPHAPGPLPACSLPRSRNAPEERRGGCGALGQPPSPSRTRAAATHVGVAGPRERHLQVVEARGAECVEPVHDLLGAEEGVGPASALAACGGWRPVGAAVNTGGGGPGGWAGNRPSWGPLARDGQGTKGWELRSKPAGPRALMRRWVWDSFSPLRWGYFYKPNMLPRARLIYF